MLANKKKKSSIKDEDDCLIMKFDTAYTIGRSNEYADINFNDPYVSKRHCQILFDSSYNKLYILNGVLLFDTYCNVNCIVNQFRVRDKMIGGGYCDCIYDFKAALNGVFVNGVKIDIGEVVELGAGDVVMLVCSNKSGVCEGKSAIGFVVRKVVVVDVEGVVVLGFDRVEVERERLIRSLVPCKRVFALRVGDGELSRLDVLRRAKFLKGVCSEILGSDDPVSCIRRCVPSCSFGGVDDCVIEGKTFAGVESIGNRKASMRSFSNVDVVKQGSFETFVGEDNEGLGDDVQIIASTSGFGEKTESSLPKAHTLYPNECSGVGISSVDDNKKIKNLKPFSADGMIPVSCEAISEDGCQEKLPAPPGKDFYLNGLKSMYQSSSGGDKVISLTELLRPVDSISRMFIATFTSDVEWFLSYCEIPSHLPVTIACHDTEKCWSGDLSKRSCAPYPNFPNLVVLYPPFPESIAFGKDRKNRGVGCHHPKLFVLQREDFIRVIITSANLVPKQWHNVTNTVWWQDFPRRKLPDCRPLFKEFNENSNFDLRSDFAAQLSGFMATLVTDVPSEAYWIVELTKYDFSGAIAYLVASVPGIHSYRSVSANSPVCEFKCNEMFLGSVETCVVGVSYLFRTKVDSNGVRLKKLATYLGKSIERGCGISEILLRREKNIRSDPNAVSVVIPNPMELSKRDFVQLGFLPRAVAKWVSPLWDMGFFKFCGHLCPKDALAVAFGENSLKVQLVLHVSQGSNILEMPKMMEREHVIAFCSLVASLQRCTGLWRMEEVLHQYNWPEPLESDFIYGSSSIGTSVSPQFFAAFSAAGGKRSQHVFDSEESDPEWGCWTVADELKNPSIRIIFPTIDRVKSSSCGILPSKCLLSFSEKTWQRLKMTKILHDAVPHPCERVGYPMHVKVARRRFKSKTDGTSFGWIYSGSHNMSAAAWGRPISTQSGSPVGRTNVHQSCLRLHVCNYELGLIFVFPSPKKSVSSSNNSQNLDDISLPFLVPAPRYGPTDRPATMRAMSEALAVQGRHLELAAVAEVPDEDDEVVENCIVGLQEEEEENAYADILWHQVDSSLS